MRGAQQGSEALWARRVEALVCGAAVPESSVSLVVAGLGSAGRVGAGAPSRRDS